MTVPAIRAVLFDADGPRECVASPEKVSQIEDDIMGRKIGPDAKNNGIRQEGLPIQCSLFPIGLRSACVASAVRQGKHWNCSQHITQTAGPNQHWLSRLPAELKKWSVRQRTVADLARAQRELALGWQGPAPSLGPATRTIATITQPVVSQSGFDLQELAGFGTGHLEASVSDSFQPLSWCQNARGPGLKY